MKMLKLRTFAGLFAVTIFCSSHVHAAADSCSSAFAADRLGALGVIANLQTSREQLREKAEQLVNEFVNDSRIWSPREKRTLRQIESMVRDHAPFEGLRLGVSKGKWELQGEQAQRFLSLLKSLKVLKSVDTTNLNSIALHLVSYKGAMVTEALSQIFFSPVHVLATQLDNLKFTPAYRANIKPEISERALELERLGRFAFGGSKISIELTQATGAAREFYSDEVVNHLIERANSLIAEQNRYLNLVYGRNN